MEHAPPPRRVYPPSPSRAASEGTPPPGVCSPQQDIDVKLRTRAQLAELAEGYFRRQYVRDQVFGTEELYKTLGLIQEEDNLQQVIEGILLQQVVALFDDEGEVLYVPSDAAAFGAVEELGYASAYMAGLQQQLFNVSELRR